VPKIFFLKKIPSLPSASAKNFQKKIKNLCRVPGQWALGKEFSQKKENEDPLPSAD
jgi:hypothetical protein